VMLRNHGARTYALRAAADPPPSTLAARIANSLASTLFLLYGESNA
jgi:hypothetical protein